MELLDNTYTKGNDITFHYNEKEECLIFTNYLTVRVANLVEDFCNILEIDLNKLDEVFTQNVGSEYMLNNGLTNDWYIVPVLYWFCVDYNKGIGDPLYELMCKLKYKPSPMYKNIYDEDDESAIKLYEWLESEV